MVLSDYIQQCEILKRFFDLMDYCMGTMEYSFVHTLIDSFDLNEASSLDNETVVKLEETAKQKLQTTDLSNRDIQEICNVVAIFCQAAVIIKDDVTPGKSIEPSWVTRFYDYAKSYSDSDNRNLWSKILSKEFIKPGSFFKRTLNVLYEAEKFEVDWFYEASKFVFDRGCMPSFVLNDNKYFAFNKFQTIIDGGFVNPTLAGISYDKDETMHFTSVDISFKLEKGPYGLNVYTLTDAGMQLFELRAQDTEDVFLNDLKDRMEKSGALKDIVIKHKNG